MYILIHTFTVFYFRSVIVVLVSCRKTHFYHAAIKKIKLLELLPSSSMKNISNC